MLAKYVTDDGANSGGQLRRSESKIYKTGQDDCKDMQKVAQAFYKTIEDRYILQVAPKSHDDSTSILN